MYVPKHCSALLALLSGGTLALAQILAVPNPPVPPAPLGPKNHWTGIWTTMPQLTEPANLPPAPYVSS